MSTIKVTNLQHDSSAAANISLTSTGRVGIGNNSPGGLLHLGNGTSNSDIILDKPEAGAGTLKFFKGGSASAYIQYDASEDLVYYSPSGAGSHIFYTGGNEAARIDSSRRLLVGTSSDLSNYDVQIANANGDGFLSMLSYSSTASNGVYVTLNHSKSGTLGTHTLVSSGDMLGTFRFRGSDGSSFVDSAAITAEVDGTPGTNDMPGRLVFSTTRDGASSPTTALTINRFGVATFQTEVDAFHLNVDNTNATYSSRLIFGRSARAANSAYYFLNFQSNAGSDDEFILRGDGQAYADGSWNGGGADYAEYFEWSDSNPSDEDRRGISVVLDGDKIREAVSGEDPIGVISGNPSVVGDAAWNKWSGKYLRDEFGSYIQEDYEVENEDGNTVVQQRRKLNPAYDPDVEYVPREQRPEWDCVGLMGKLRIRKGQVTGSRWIKMRDISDSVEEWLVR